MKKIVKIITIFLLIINLVFVVSCSNKKHVHEFSSDWISNGEYHWHACSQCGEIRDKEEHDWNDGITILEPTETKEGIKEYTCNTCQHKIVKPIAKLDHKHTFSEEWSYDDNYHWHKSTCGHDDVTLDKEQHNWDEGIITVAPTEDTTGIKTYKCKVCDATKTEEVPKSPHIHVFDKKVATEKYLYSEATCTTSAKYFYSCKCGEKGIEVFEFGNPKGHTYSNDWSFDDNYHWHQAICEHSNLVDAKAEHDWDEGITTVEPTEESTGIKTLKCKTCQKTKNEIIPKLPHVHVFDKKVPTDIYLKTEAGCTTRAQYYYSCRCGEIGTEFFEYGEPKGHTYSTEWSSNSDYHWHAATCEHTDLIIDKNLHNWGFGVITVIPTETTEGVRTFKCKDCNREKTEVVSRLEPGHVHNFNVKIPHEMYLASPATCLEPAKYYCTCSCGAVSSEVFNYGQPRGHTFSSQWTCDEQYHWHPATCEHILERKDYGAHNFVNHVCLGCGYIEKFEVKFIGPNNELLDIQNVDYGKSAIAPSNTVFENYEFISWDKDFSAITKDITIKAKCIKLYTVTFLDNLGDVIKTIKVKEGANAIAPVAPDKEGLVFVRWDNNLTNINENITVNAIYALKQFKVTFTMPDGTIIPYIDYNGNKKDYQLVDYGTFAVEPNKPKFYFEWQKDGKNVYRAYNFTKWNTSFDIVKNDLTVVADYSNDTFDRPIIAVQMNYKNGVANPSLVLCNLNKVKIYGIDFTISYKTKLDSLTYGINVDDCEFNRAANWLYSGTSPLYNLSINNNTKELKFAWSSGKGVTFNTYGDFINSINLSTSGGAESEINNSFKILEENCKFIVSEDNGKSFNKIVPLIVYK